MRSFPLPPFSIIRKKFVSNRERASERASERHLFLHPCAFALADSKTTALSGQLRRQVVLVKEPKVVGAADRAATVDPMSP